MGLAAAAAVTTTLKVATGITLVAQRDPLWLAKEVASLDALSGGRFIFGIGYGWNIEEMEDHGVPTGRRRAVVREKILAMKELWANDKASFSGTYVNFEPSWAWPKPTQKPHPPILIGAAPTEVTFRHVVEYADGWMPIEGRWPITEKLAELRKAAEAAGRDPESLIFGVFGIKPEIPHIEAQMAAGVSIAALTLPAAPVTRCCRSSTATPRSWIAFTLRERVRPPRDGRSRPGSQRRDLGQCVERPNFGAELSRSCDDCRVGVTLADSVATPIAWRTVG